MLPALRLVLSSRRHLFFPALTSAHMREPFFEVGEQVLLVHGEVNRLALSRLGAHPLSQPFPQCFNFRIVGKPKTEKYRVALLTLFPHPTRRSALSLR